MYNIMYLGNFKETTILEYKEHINMNFINVYVYYYHNHVKVIYKTSQHFKAVEN